MVEIERSHQSSMSVTCESRCPVSLSFKHRAPSSPSFPSPPSLATMDDLNIMEWDENDVQAWLTSLGFPQYESRIKGPLSSPAAIVTLFLSITLP